MTLHCVAGGVGLSSPDYDSGAAETTTAIDHVTLHALFEKHHPEYLQQISNTQYGPGFLDMANMVSANTARMFSDCTALALQ